MYRQQQHLHLQLPLQLQQQPLPDEQQQQHSDTAVLHEEEATFRRYYPTPHDEREAEEWKMEDANSLLLEAGEVEKENQAELELNGGSLGDESWNGRGGRRNRRKRRAGSTL